MGHKDLVTTVGLAHTEIPGAGASVHEFGEIRFRP